MSETQYQPEELLPENKNSNRSFLRNDLLSLATWVGIVVCVMLLGGWATFSSVNTWYPTLNKPSFNPPAWLFGPVWTALYLMMAVSVWLIWRQRRDVAKRPRVHQFTFVFCVQLLLNLAWSFIFFGLRSPAWAFVEICLLWLAIAATIGIAFRLHRVSALLLLLYLAWSTFALILNFAIYRLN